MIITKYQKEMKTIASGIINQKLLLPLKFKVYLTIRKPTSKKISIHLLIK